MVACKTNKRKVCVTGAAGFVGHAVMERLVTENIDVLALVRTLKNLDDRVRLTTFDCNNAGSLPITFFDGCDAVIHCAALTNNHKVTNPKPVIEYKTVNTDFPVFLAKMAIASGVRRFVFLSSVKVNDVCAIDPTSFASSPHDPQTDLYAVSKMEAEQKLIKLTENTSMELVIIRPPLVYGPGVKGNFAKLILLVKGGIPLPFRLVDNRRSFIALENLVDFILLCADVKRSPKAANQTFCISDCEVFSTKTVLQKISKAYDKNLFLFPFPVFMLSLILALFQKKKLAERILGNLIIDSSKATALLGWKPKVTMCEQLTLMALSDVKGQKK